MSEEDFPCPQCWETVSKTDKHCRNCGANLVGMPETQPTIAPPPPQQAIEEPYERRLSLGQRFYKLLIAPSEAMRDIALAPDYTGFFAILAFDFVLTAVALAMVLQKIQFSGTYSVQISSILSGILAVAVFIALILVVVRWLVKSFIVRSAGDSGSSWSFRTAASVTGYAYFADVIFSIVGIVISWYMIPTFRVDTTNLNAAIEQMSNYRAQMNWLKLTFTLPLNLLGLAWKSYLGGLGTHFGTNGKCSKSIGFIVFFVLGLIGLLISFVASP